jgi:hypothetical protein
MTDKKGYIEELTALMVFTINEQINPLDYENLSDVNSTANTPMVDGEDAMITTWRIEAKKILLWMTTLWILRNAHVDGLEYPTDESPISFVETLPKFI